MIRYNWASSPWTLTFTKMKVKTIEKHTYAVMPTVFSTSKSLAVNMIAQRKTKTIGNATEVVRASVQRATYQPSN